MPVAIDQIATGRCYASRFGEIRRVISNDQNSVVFESRQKTELGSISHSLQEGGLQKFAQEVDWEVPCDGPWQFTGR
jgi:hypothetical protein